MSELQEIVLEKIRRNLSELKDVLRTRLGQKRSEFAARNILSSNMHVRAIVSECSRVYKEAIPIICEELEWWLKQCLCVTETKATEIADFGVKQMAQSLDVELNSLVRGFK